MIEFNYSQSRAERESYVRELLEQQNVSAAARLLGMTCEMGQEKGQLAEQLTRNDPASPDLIPLMRHLSPDRLNEIVSASIGVPSRNDLLLEIARHAPEVVRPFVQEIADPRIVAALRCGAPDDWVRQLLEAYEQDGDAAHIRAIGQVRTDFARNCLIDISKKLPQDSLGELAVALENCGIFFASRFPSIYFDAFRAYVVRRDESPHHMGPGFLHAVPLCPFCGTPGERLLTLDAGALGDDYDLNISPSFFWYRCRCDNGGYTVIRHTNAGVEGIMTAMTDGPVESALPPTSLLLREFPRTSVVGGPARPGSGEHQVGGYPVWIEYSPFPSVPGEDRGMMFLASIDLATTPLGQATGDRGIAYCFFDDESRISVTMRQL